MNDCLFCKIIQGDIPSKKVYEDTDVYAFYDINPKAPTHILAIPKKHISQIATLDQSDELLVGKVVYAVKKIADELDLMEGYRIVFNNGPAAGQEVYHIHAHLLGGRTFSWPPG